MAELAVGFHTAEEVATTFVMAATACLYELQVERFPNYIPRAARQLEAVLVREYGERETLVEYDRLEEVLHVFADKHTLVAEWELSVNMLAARTITLLRAASLLAEAA